MLKENVEEFDFYNRLYSGSSTLSNLFSSLSAPCIGMCSTDNITDKPSGKTGPILIIKEDDGSCGAICFCTDGTIQINNYNSSTKALTGWKTFSLSGHTHDHSEVKGMASNRVMTSNPSGVLTESSVTTTQLGYLNGVTSPIQTQLNNKAASNHSHALSSMTGTLDASKITGTFTGVSNRWKLGNAASSSADYVELRNSGSSPNVGLSLVFHDTSANSNTFYNLINEKGELLFADKEYVDEQFDTLLGVGGHWNSQEKYYKSINIKYGGDGANYGNICFLLVIGCVFLINIPQPTSSFKNCKYTKILDPTESSYVINLSACQVINDGSLKRLKMTFSSNINMSVNVMPLSAPIKITEIYSGTS